MAKLIFLPAEQTDKSSLLLKCCLASSERLTYMKLNRQGHYRSVAVNNFGSGLNKQRKLTERWRVVLSGEFPAWQPRQQSLEKSYHTPVALVQHHLPVRSSQHAPGQQQRAQGAAWKQPSWFHRGDKEAQCSVGEQTYFTLQSYQIKYDLYL